MSTAALSDREFTVFKKLAAGERLTNIAIDLELSIKTVSTYRKRLLKKLNIKTNAEIAEVAKRLEAETA